MEKDSNNMNAQSRYSYEFTRIPLARYVTESWRLLRLRNWRVVKSSLLATRGIIGINRVGEMKIETELYIVFLSFRTFIIRNCIIFLGSKTCTRNFALHPLQMDRFGNDFSFLFAIVLIFDRRNR